MAKKKELSVEVSSAVLILAGVAVIAWPHLIAYLVGLVLIFKGIVDIFGAFGT
jgi:uncharacterized membrane protein HdeD (DUF308 family)